MFPLHIRARSEHYLDTVLAAMFPDLGRPGVPEGNEKPRDILAPINRELVEFGLIRFPDGDSAGAGDRAEALAGEFDETLGNMASQLRDDAEAIFEGDPAAPSVDEVILYYPGFLAIAIYRVAHALWSTMGGPVPRILASIAHSRTAIDINPGATIGRRFSIDHGTGIVIGATAVLGNSVKLYQGVTLGALRVQKSEAKNKRHPTIEDNVVIYANATILGGATVIGHDTIVGGNAFITESVPPFSFATHSADVRTRKAGEGSDLEFYI